MGVREGRESEPARVGGDLQALTSPVSHWLAPGPLGPQTGFNQIGCSSRKPWECWREAGVAGCAHFRLLAYVHSKILLKKASVVALHNRRHPQSGHPSLPFPYSSLFVYLSVCPLQPLPQRDLIQCLVSALGPSSCSKTLLTFPIPNPRFRGAPFCLNPRRRSSAFSSCTFRSHCPPGAWRPGCELKKPSWRLGAPPQLRCVVRLKHGLRCRCLELCASLLF